MRNYVELLFKGMVEQDSFVIPMAPRYKATENEKASALKNMGCFRTVTKLNYIAQLFVDKERNQVFFTANVDESGMETIAYGRLKVENELISEVEITFTRSRADSGFVYLANEMNTLPEGWTSDIPEGQKASREELTKLAEAIFNQKAPGVFEAADTCILMEVGGIVYEDPDYLHDLSTPDADEVVSKELVTIPGGLWPERPQDLNARVLIVDEENGVAISTGIIPGYVCPYVVTNETGSCFVPECMIEMHRRTVDESMFDGRNVLHEMPASASTVEMIRFHSGKIQGMHRYINIQGPKAVSPWCE